MVGYEMKRKNKKKMTEAKGKRKLNWKYFSNSRNTVQFKLNWNFKFKPQHSARSTRNMANNKYNTVSKIKSFILQY